MQQRGNQPGFGPIYSQNSTALILGSYPSPKSFDQGFYYGHPQNRFWPLLASLAGWQTPQTIQQKTALVLQNSLALWDSLLSCQITGASDASIKNPVPNEIAALLQKTKIEAIFCNGAAAHKIYMRFCYPATGLTAVCLPSTSPANAAYNMQRLQQCWQPLCPYIKPT